MSLTILKNELSENKTRNIYLLYGAEDFLIKKYISKIQENVVNNEFADMNITVMEGNFDFQTFYDTCQTVPFFSEKRFVLVKKTQIFKPAKVTSDVSSKKVKKTKDKDKNKDELIDFLKNIPSHICLVFWETDIDKRLKAIDIMKEHGLLVEFAYQKPADLSKWIGQSLKSNKIDITFQDASFLVEFSEPDMTFLDSQMQKLISFGSEKGIITREDIEQICNKSLKAKIFDLTDAISEKDIKKALLLLEEMIEMKEPITKLFFMIAKQFRSILYAKMIKSGGFGRAQLVEKMKVHPFVGEKLFKYADKFSFVELKDAIKESYNMDLANKNGLIDGRIGAEIIITKVFESLAK